MMWVKHLALLPRHKYKKRMRNKDRTRETVLKLEDQRLTRAVGGEDISVQKRLPLKQHTSCSDTHRSLAV